MTALDFSRFAEARRRVPIATYRLQLHNEFTFGDARSLVTYLDDLGVTDCYISPCLAARRGSTHGYDICDHSRLNPELGSEDEFRAWNRDLQARGMGLVVDFVPNHVGVDPDENPWWRDLLENGSCSHAAHFFDIDWDPVKPELKGKILLPILGDHYGKVLEQGQLQLELRNGALTLNYFDRNLPVNPRQAPRLYQHGIDQLRHDLGEDHPDLRDFLSILFTLTRLPAYTETDPALIAEREREKTLAEERLAALVERSPRVRLHIQENIQLFNGAPGRPRSFDLLHELLEEQPYRLAYWRTAQQEINYRRFFDINDLAGLRMEDPSVFRETHKLILRLMREGLITGLRLDHVDGLFDPAGYFDRLQEAVTSAWAAEECGLDSLPEGHLEELRRWRRGADSGTANALALRPFYVAVEKILSAGELLPGNWAVSGTSGYEFLNDVNGVFVDSRNERAFRQVYARFTGHQTLISDVIYECKGLIMRTAMASELNVLAHELNRISESDRRTRDFTLDSLRQALREIVACFPVYRTYVDESGWTELDRKTIETALTRAIRRNPATEPSIFQFVEDALLPDRSRMTEEDCRRRLRLSMKFQQYTGPVQAKGLEDTAFYRYVPLLSLNEVGGDLYRFGRTPEAFHAANAERLSHWPASMLCTATHDTKRGEDARARLNVLSEMPETWWRRIAAWSSANQALRGSVDGQPAPDPNDEYMLYQTLLAVWPSTGPSQPTKELAERVRNYMTKALKEAKTHTSWIHANEAYDRAVTEFVDQVLLGPGARRFLPSFVRFQRRIAHLGMVNSLSQLVLKMMSPGVPDFYQGTELWDLSLVDPDNRRPVDYKLRRRLFKQLKPLIEGDHEGDRSAAVAEMLRHWHDAQIKLYVTACGLHLRRRCPALFLEGDYLPLEVRGARANHLIAFARQHGGQAVVVLVPRLVAALAGPEGTLPVGEHIWQDTRISLHGVAPTPVFRNLLTGGTLAAVSDGGNTSLSASEALPTCPVAILTAAPADCH